MFGIMKDTEVKKEGKSLVFPLAQELFGSFAPPDFPQRYEPYHYKKYSLLQLETTPWSSPKSWFSPLDVSFESNTITNLLIMSLIFRQFSDESFLLVYCTENLPWSLQKLAVPTRENSVVCQQ